MRRQLDQVADVDVVAEAADGVSAIAAVAEHRPDVVVMDVRMPYMDGARATERILQDHPRTRVLAYTAHADSGHVINMIVSGAVGYVVKQGDIHDLANAVRGAAIGTPAIDDAAVSGLFSGVLDLAREERLRRRESQQLAEQFAQLFGQTIRALAAAIEERDGYTGGHDHRVAELSIEVGARMGLAEDQLRDLELGAVFHDIGKIAIPDSILHGSKPVLDEEEWKIVREHTIVGARIIGSVELLAGAARIVRASHEHWDGGGYPDGLRGAEIPVGARIVLACDAYDAMTSGRSYQTAMGVAEACSRLQELVGTHFDPDVIDALLATVNARQKVAAEAEAGV